MVGSGHMATLSSVHESLLHVRVFLFVSFWLWNILVSANVVILGKAFSDCSLFIIVMR